MSGVSMVSGGICGVYGWCDWLVCTIRLRYGLGGSGLGVYCNGGVVGCCVFAAWSEGLCCVPCKVKLLFVLWIFVTLWWGVRCLFNCV